MPSSVELRIAAVDRLLSRLIPLLNQISSSAWFVQQGQVRDARQVEDELTRWLMQNRDVLPDDVTGSVSRLSARITEWIMSLGTSTTPHSFATDDTASFDEVRRVLSTYKRSLLDEVDVRDETMRVKVAKSAVRPNPWVSGSFYLAATVVLLVLLLVISRLVAWWLLPLVILGSLLGVTIVGAFQLRQDRALSEKTFVSLILATLRQLRLLHRGSREPE